jgi:biopolymer transport protein TolR
MGASVGRRGKRGGGFRDINITPFVDVMLVLLVVFMVTAPLLTTGLRIDLPEVQAASTPVKDARLLVTVTKDEHIMFGEKDVTDTIDVALKESVRVQTERELYIRADKDARYGIVAKVVAAARNSGVQSLNLLVQPELEEDTGSADSGPSASAPAGQPSPVKPGPAAPGKAEVQPASATKPAKSAP